MDYMRLVMQNDMLRSQNMELFKTVIGIQNNGPLLGSIEHKKAKTDASENTIDKNMIDVDDDAQPVFEKQICEEKAKLKK
ncbi:hypothetical protein H0H87_005561 [Tephrocybe sp. NHM501043]|nr:hypothetical protein H0H87_005561 [Tephrocybe sp. NHM501043]